MAILNQIYYYAIFTVNSVILLSVLPFSDGLNFLKGLGVSVIFVLFVLKRFASDLSEVF